MGLGWEGMEKGGRAREGDRERESESGRARAGERERESEWEREGESCPPHA